jgi:pregnancy-associated plasma protein-A
LKALSLILVLLLALLCNGTVAAASNQPQSICGLPDVPPALAAAAEDLSAQLRPPVPKASSIRIPIAFHVIFAGQNGLVTNTQIRMLVRNLNGAFTGTPFSFYLTSIDRTENANWYSNCGLGSRNERRMKLKLARDPSNVLNIYSCTATNGGQVVAGFAYLPFMFAESSFMHGVVLHPTVLPGGGNPDYGRYGLIGAHEVGHYLGLYHIFQGGCADGDFVADTPAQFTAHFGCPVGSDTCPGSAGLDDVRNYMDYTSDICMNHFTPGQVDRMASQSQVYRPSLWR